MNQDMDKIIGRKLAGAEHPYPTDLWDRISPEIPTYRNTAKRRAWPVILLAICLVLAALSWWVIQDQEGSGTHTSHRSAAIQVKPQPTNKRPGQAAPAGIADPVIREEMSRDTETSMLSEKGQVGERAEGVALKEDGTDHVPVSGDNRPAPATGRDQAAGGLPVANHPGDMDHNPRLPDLKEPALLEALLKRKPMQASPIRKPAPAFLHQNTSLLPGSFMEISPDPSCYSFGKRHQANYTIDVYTGLGISLRPMRSSDEDVSNYIQAREDTERFQYLFTLGARFNMMMNSGLAFRAGLHYTQIGEKFDYTDTSAVRIITIIDTTFAGGDTIVNTTQEVQEGTLIKKINNRFHSIDIPILVGYDVPLGRMQASVSAGPVINISAWQRGQFLSPSLEPVFIETENPDYYPAYKTSLGIGAYLSASLAIPISERIWLFGEPHVLHRFNPVTLDDYPIRQRNTNFGLNVGLKLKL